MPPPGKWSKPCRFTPEKKRYRDPFTAERAAVLLGKLHKQILIWYRCPACEDYHLTSRVG